MSATHSNGGRSFSLMSSPIGWLGVVAGEKGLIEVLIQSDPVRVRECIADNHPGVRAGKSADAEIQLQEYFHGQRRAFSLHLDFSPISPFTRQILLQLAEVPFGQTVTYGELARRCGHPGAARAVGRAMAANPFAIILPCHRVVGAGGRLTGYSGGEGVSTKSWLLDFEREQAAGQGRAEKNLQP